MKKGFTLVELLAVLLIIALISTLAFKSILKTSKDSKAMTQKTYEKLVLASARSYVTNDENIKNILKAEHQYQITYQTLIDEGYLTKDVIDFTNNKKINTSTYYVCITYNLNAGYKYAINECK